MKKISGLLILGSLLLSIFAYFYDPTWLIVSGVFAWMALLLEYKSLSKKKALNILFVLSFFAFSFAIIQGFSVDWIRVFTINQYLLSLLIGVGFLRLIATPKQEKVKKLPTGQSSFLRTYLGVHLFGSVINLSSLILVADKLYKKGGALSSLQIMTLTRAFSSDAFWSPFFVAFAAALTYMPNLSASMILTHGVVLALIAFVLTYIEAKKRFEIEHFKGYPIHFETLYIPFLLALLVLVSNYYDTSLKVIVLIALYSLLLTVVILPLKKGMSKAYKKFTQHITEELPNMRMEMGLFLVAGMFGVSISTLLVGFDVTIPLNSFSWFEASVLLLIFIILAFIGIHPIITIAVVGDLLSQFDHTLLAITFLMAWSITVSCSPFSGLNLTIQGRYGILAKEIFKVNLPYAVKMYVVCAMMLFFVSNFLK